MLKLAPWIIVLFFIRHSLQTCTSTVAVTSCTSDAVKPNKPLKVDGYKSLMSFSRGSLESIPSGTFKLVPQVTILHLNHNKIQHVEANSFQGLRHLRQLNLYDNQLKSVEINIFSHCPDLEILDLGMNKISSIHDKAFEDLVRLKSLNLGFNSLKRIPPALNSLYNLEILGLNNNLIVTLKSNSFSGLSKLEGLFLNDNKITTIENHILKGLRSLKQLDLRSNYLSDINVDDLLGDASSLRSISLSINEFKCGVLKQIINKFENKNVEVIRGLSKSQNNIYGISCKS